MTFDRFEKVFNNLEDWKKIQLWNDPDYNEEDWQ